MMMVVVVEAGGGRGLEQAGIEAEHVEMGSRRRFCEKKGVMRRCYKGFQAVHDHVAAGGTAAAWK